MSQPRLWLGAACLLLGCDPMFAKLLLWADRDGDRKSTPGEVVDVYLATSPPGR